MKTAVIVLAIALGPWLSVLPAQPAAPGVAQFLGLSETQRSRFQQLLETLQATVGGLEQRINLAQQRLEPLLSRDPVDPAAVGAVLVEIRGVQKQVERALQSYHESFQALLTKEQQEKTQAVAQAGQLFPSVRAFAEVRLIAPPR